MTKKRAKQDVSLDQIRDLLYAALRKMADGKEDGPYLMEVYGSYLIYEIAGQCYRSDYSILDGAAHLADTRTEVERQWVEKRSAQAEHDATLTDRLTMAHATDPEGSVWEVVIAEPGFTKNGWYHPEAVLRAAADEGVFEGVDVCLFELPQGVTHIPDNLFAVKNLLTKNKAGWIDGVSYAQGRGLMGVLHFLDSFKWLGANFLEAQAQGVAPYGLSYDAVVRAKTDTIDGQNVICAKKFAAADSVDIVSRPAAGGKFQRAVQAHDKGEDVMKKKELIAMLKKQRQDLVAGKDLDNMADDELVELARMAMTPENADPATKTPAGDNPAPAAGDDPDPVAVLRCEMSMDKQLTASELPDKMQARVRQQFTGKVFEEDELTRAIQSEKDLLAELSAPAEPEPVPGRQTLVVGIGSLERAQMAMDKAFGFTKDQIQAMAADRMLDNRPQFTDLTLRGTQAITPAQAVDGYDDAPAFGSLLEAYAFFTGDPEVRGHFNRNALAPDLRASMAITSATFSYLLGNTMHRRLVQAYRATDFLEALLISSKKRVTDFRTQEAVMIGYFPDLATVDPESADYQEIAGITDEESTYAIGQKGNLLTITRKTIKNDDLSVIARIVDRLGRAGRRTHAKYVWAKFTANANCSDGTAWFTAPHANLGSAALSFATVLAAYQALAGMTEKDSGEHIGLLDDPSVKPTLVYPIDLMATGEQIVNDDHYYSSNDLTTKTRNPVKGKIKGAQVGLLSDANDWGLLLPPSEVDMVEMGYMDGRQEPEMFVADSPQSEQVFVADKIRHKIRHEYAGAVVDFRSGYKAVVA